MARRRPTRLTNRPAILLGLALAALFAGLAYAQPTHGIHAHTAAPSDYWEQIQTKCTTEETQAGMGCWNTNSKPKGWTVGGSSASYDAPDGTYSTTFTYSVPSQIPVDGTTAVTLATATMSNNGAGSDGHICVAGDFSVQESGSPCVDAYAPTTGSSDSKSKTFHLVGNSSGMQVQVGLEYSYNVRFAYKLVSSKPPPPPPPPPESAVKRCLGNHSPSSYVGAAADRPRAYAAAPHEVHVVKVCPDVQFHKGGTPPDAWLPVELDTVLKAGDEITCDPDGVVVVAFADNSTVVISNTTQLKIGSFFTEGGVVRTEILLKMGEVAAQVNKSAATKSDFRIKSPSFGGVRGEGDVGARAAASAPGVYAGPGAALTVFYAPGSKTELVSASAGPVAFAPPNPSLTPVVVPAGDAVEATPTYESPLGPIGHVGTRGGDDIVAAQERVSAVIGKARKACHDDTAHSYAFSIKPAGKGWTVAVTLGGRVRGTARFSVTGSSVKPANALARSVAKGCAR
jgi:hypothetical protein